MGKIIHTMDIRQHPSSETPVLIQQVHVPRYHHARSRGITRAQQHSLHLHCFHAAQFPMYNFSGQCLTPDISAIHIPKEIINFLIAGGRQLTSIILRGWIIFTIIHTYYVNEFAIYFCSTIIHELIEISCLSSQNTTTHWISFHSKECRN